MLDMGFDEEVRRHEIAFVLDVVGFYKSTFFSKNISPLTYLEIE